MVRAVVASLRIVVRFCVLSALRLHRTILVVYRVNCCSATKGFFFRLAVCSVVVYLCNLWIFCGAGIRPLFRRWEFPSGSVIVVIRIV